MDRLRKITLCKGGRVSALSFCFRVSINAFDEFRVSALVPSVYEQYIAVAHCFNQRVFARGHFVSSRYCGHNNAKRIVVCLASCIRRLSHPVMVK